MTTGIRALTVAALLVGATVAVTADTLYLRDGTRIEGRVVSVRDRVLEFAEVRGNGAARTRQFDLDDVMRIDFEAPSTGRRGGGRPSGLREKFLIVSANVPWSDTEVDVRTGQDIYIEAKGQIRWGTGDRRDGPDGEVNSPLNRNRPIPNRGGGALIGKVGGSSPDIFFVGSQSGPIRMRASGRLFLGINDDLLTDNSGNFQVVVYY